MVKRLRSVEPLNHPVDIGARVEAEVTAELLRRGITVLQPYGSNHRYDLVLELGGEFIRAQCKAGRLRNGVVRFSTVSVRSNTRRTVITDYREQADIFLVYCRETGGTYAVPVDDLPVGHGVLRVVETANGQTAGIRWAADYALPA